SEVIARSDVGAIALHRLSEATRTAIAPHLAKLSRPGAYDGIVLPEWDMLASEASYSMEGMSHSSMPVDSLVEAASTNRISEPRFEDAVARVLRAKYRLGLFGQALSGKLATSRTKAPMPAHNREIALDLARRCAVLLRNMPATLPLGIDSGEILIVGPAASDRHISLGGRKGLAASVIDGLEQLGVPHRYVPGLALRNNGTPVDRLIDADRMAIGMACEAAKRAGTVVVVLPTGESATLGEAQQQLLTSLSRSNDQTVLVTIGKTAIDPVIQGRYLPSVLHAGELGAMGGHAIAELLTAEASPSGKLVYGLPGTKDRPGLPFGHGETYADFALTDLALDFDSGRIRVNGALRNVGEREGTETAQLYVRYLAQKDTKRRLVDIARVSLRPGERQYLSFEITREDIGLPTSGSAYAVASGEYEVFLGTSMVRGISETAVIDEEFARIMAQDDGSRPSPHTGRRTA
ncbi:MAG: glycoside hydrolase family 3 C-terminal domain-containing protein, partial [Erythrobacter sp.]|nr:glycoside hydrolase family 3 C-terminal domain-containing protein [Erythrobacter sp.]